MFEEKVTVRIFFLFTFPPPPPPSSSFFFLSTMAARHNPQSLVVSAGGVLSTSNLNTAHHQPHEKAILKEGSVSTAATQLLISQLNGLYQSQLFSSVVTLVCVLIRSLLAMPPPTPV